MEVQGRKVKMSIWVRSLSFLPLPCSPLDIRFLPVSLRLGKGQTLRCLFALFGTALQDTAGQERFRTITASYYRGAQGVILGTSVFQRCIFCLLSSGFRTSLVHMRTRVIVYDVSSRESFEALPRWLEELENYVPPEVVKIVVGNKLDKVSNDPWSFSFRIFPPSNFFTSVTSSSRRKLPTGFTHTRASSRSTLDKCPRPRPRRSRRARDVFSSRRPPRRRWA